MNEQTTESYKDRSVWLRGLYMLIFMLFLWVAKFVTYVVTVFQFFTVVLTANANEKLVKFGNSLSIYQYQILMFLTYNSEEHPFPMGEWPEQLNNPTKD